MGGLPPPLGCPRRGFLLIGQRPITTSSMNAAYAPEDPIHDFCPAPGEYAAADSGCMRRSAIGIIP